MAFINYKALIIFTSIIFQACNNRHQEQIPPLPNDLESDYNIALQIQSLKDILAKNPENDVALYRIAVLYGKINDIEKSYQAAKKITILQPNNTSYALFLISCYLKKELYVDAYDMLEKQKTKISVSEYENLALEIYLHNGKYELAEIIIDKQLKDYPNNLYFIIKKAELALSLKDTCKSLEMYEKSLRLDSNSVSVLVELATLYNCKKEYVKSLVLSEKVLKIDSTNIEANFNNAIAFKYLGFKDSALFYYQKVLQSDSLHAKALYNSAIIYLQKNDYLKSENYLKRIDTDNNLPNLNFKLAYTLQKQHKFEEALWYYQRIDTSDANYNQAQNAILKIKFESQYP